MKLKFSSIGENVFIEEMLVRCLIKIINEWKIGEVLRVRLAYAKIFLDLYQLYMQLKSYLTDT